MGTRWDPGSFCFVTLQVQYKASLEHSGKASACQARDVGSIPGSGRSPGEENGNPLQYSGLESHGQRSLAGCNP